MTDDRAEQSRAEKVHEEHLGTSRKTYLKEDDLNYDVG